MFLPHISKYQVIFGICSSLEIQVISSECSTAFQALCNLYLYVFLSTWSVAHMKPHYFEVIWRNFSLIKTPPQARERDYITGQYQFSADYDATQMIKDFGIHTSYDDEMDVYIMIKTIMIQAKVIHFLRCQT